MRIDGRVFAREGIDVGDPYQNFDLACPELLSNFDLIEIPGIVVVNGGPEQRSQVANASVGCNCRWVRLDFSNLLLNGWRKLRIETSLPHNLFRNRSKIYFKG